MPVEFSAVAFALQARALLAASIDDLAHVAMMLDRVQLPEAEWRQVGAVILDRARCRASVDAAASVHRAYSDGACAEVWPVSAHRQGGDLP